MEGVKNHNVGVGVGDGIISTLVGGVGVETG